jgi:hypothetical protein
VGNDINVFKIIQTLNKMEACLQVLMDQDYETIEKAKVKFVKNVTMDKRELCISSKLSNFLDSEYRDKDGPVSIKLKEVGFDKDFHIQKRRNSKVTNISSKQSTPESEVLQKNED